MLRWIATTRAIRISAAPKTRRWPGSLPAVSILEDRVRAAIAAAGLDLRSGEPQGWLSEPTRRGNERAWPPIECMYHRLASAQLLADRIPGQRRPDNILVLDGVQHLLEIDGAQHINIHRAATLECYPADAAVGFPLEAWLVRCRRKQPGRSGGWARPCPPLFPMPGGRHRERALRDALADLLPPLHGFGPTVRLAAFEVARWISQPDAPERIHALLRERAAGHG